MLPNNTPSTLVLFPGCLGNWLLFWLGSRRQEGAFPGPSKTQLKILESKALWQETLSVSGAGLHSLGTTGDGHFWKMYRLCPECWGSLFSASCHGPLMKGKPVRTVRPTFCSCSGKGSKSTARRWWQLVCALVYVYAGLWLLPIQLLPTGLRTEESKSPPNSLLS